MHLPPSVGGTGASGRSHLILSPNDLRRLIAGREMLQERLTALLVNWDPRKNTKCVDLCRIWQPACMLWLSERLIPFPHGRYAN